MFQMKFTLTGLNKLKADISHLTDHIRNTPERVLSIAGKHLYTALINRTPVLTGVARAGWVASFDRPPPRIIPKTKQIGRKAQQASPLPAPAVPNFLSLAGNVNQAVFTKSGKGSRKSRTLYIANYVPYVQYLEAGSSSKAPAYFIQSSIVEAIRATERSLKNLW